MSRCSSGACVDSSPSSLSDTVTNEGIEDDEEEDGGRGLSDSSCNGLLLSGELGWSGEDIVMVGGQESLSCTL